MKRITAPKIAATLTTTTFFSFFPLFVWKNSRPMMAFASVLTIATFLYVGVVCLFGSKKTVVAIAWGNRRESSDVGSVFFGRFMGALFLVFMVAVLFEIFKGGFLAAYKNLGR